MISFVTSGLQKGEAPSRLDESTRGIDIDIYIEREGEGERERGGREGGGRERGNIEVQRGFLQIV